MNLKSFFKSSQIAYYTTRTKKGNTDRFTNRNKRGSALSTDDRPTDFCHITDTGYSIGVARFSSSAITIHGVTSYRFSYSGVVSRKDDQIDNIHDYLILAFAKNFSDITLYQNNQLFRIGFNIA